MSDEQINIAIAEHCGWNFNPTWAKEWDSADRWVESPTGEKMFKHAIPGYCHDLNAMHEVELKCILIDSILTDRYSHNLYDASDLPSFSSTARQRAEAFLQTIGKWEEA